MLREERLQLTQHGNNKYYRMIELDSNEVRKLGLEIPCFRATWGRVGNKGQSKIFHINLWENKIRAKVGKGYVRLTNLMVVDDQTLASETDPTIDTLLQHLQKASREQVRTNYELANYGDVTKVQLNKVQELLNSFGDMITDQASFYALTKQLAMVWTILPRKITGDLRKQKITSFEKARTQLQVEQDMIDALTAQVW